jgi:hypothetical protein
MKTTEQQIQIVIAKINQLSKHPDERTQKEIKNDNKECAYILWQDAMKEKDQEKIQTMNTILNAICLTRSFGE